MIVRDSLAKVYYSYSELPLLSYAIDATISRRTNSCRVLKLLNNFQIFDASFFTSEFRVRSSALSAVK